MRSATPLTHLITFEDGAPDATIAWGLLDGRGQQVTSGTLTPEEGSVSAVIAVSAEHNTLVPDALSGARELRWNYTSAGLMRSGRHRYRLEAFLPFGIAEDGVRRKLGVEVHELADESIDLVTAYARFGTIPNTLTDLEELAIANAVEATAAIMVIPSLQVSLAAKESSGTNQFQRAAIDWSAIRAQLDEYVTAGFAVLNPSLDETAGYSPLLVRVVRPDPVTGET